MGLTYHPPNDTLGDLSDVSIVSLASGDYLRWKGTAWVDVASSQLVTDLTGSFLLLAGGTMSGDINLGDNDLLNVNQVLIGGSTPIDAERLSVSVAAPAAPSWGATDYVIFQNSTNFNCQIHTSTTGTGQIGFSDDVLNRGYFAYRHGSDMAAIGAAGVDCATFDGTDSIIFDAVKTPDIPSGAGAADLRVDASGYVLFQTSSLRFKTVIDPQLNLSRNDPLALTPISFRFNEEMARPNGRVQPSIGYSAEDMAVHCPDAVYYDAEGLPYNIEWHAFTAIQNERMKLLAADVQAIKTRLGM